MAACRHFLKNSATKPMRLRVSSRHLLWLTLVVALAVGWITGGKRQTKSLECTWASPLHDPRERKQTHRPAAVDLRPSFHSSFFRHSAFDTRH